MHVKLSFAFTWREYSSYVLLITLLFCELIWRKQFNVTQHALPVISTWRQAAETAVGKDATAHATLETETAHVNQAGRLLTVMVRWQQYASHNS